MTPPIPDRIQRRIPRQRQQPAREIDRGLADEVQLRRLLEDHNRWTGSKRARELLDNWEVSRQKFVKVFPNEYKRALGEMHAKKAAQAIIELTQTAHKKEATLVK